MVVKIGTCSWTDPTLLKAGWYPAEADSAEARLAHYASRFPVVEVDSTYYSLPSERNATLWAERTPPGFTFDVKAFSLMTGHGTALAKLPPILRDSLPQPAAGKAGNLYLKDLPPEAQRWIWQAFDDALAPLAQAGKLGAILLQFPPWFAISRENKRYLEQCREMLPQRRLAVEFRQRSWLEERNAQETLTFLAQNDLSYVCVDEPQGFRSSIPPLTAVTNPALTVVRFHGRNRENWEARGISAAERFRYLYEEQELAEWVPRIGEVSAQASEAHVLFNNCYSDFGVRNAADLARQLELADVR
ncbi:MAG TPA: DUF72 domain-containing protein [Chloroflexota bacterium]|nr:DUF72 domain-containing protein [Chloroflexota bacterium]